MHPARPSSHESVWDWRSSEPVKSNQWISSRWWTLFQHVQRVERPALPDPRLGAPYVPRGRRRHGPHSNAFDDPSRQHSTGRTVYKGRQTLHIFHSPWIHSCNDFLGNNRWSLKNKRFPGLTLLQIKPNETYPWFSINLRTVSYTHLTLPTKRIV